jgi:hypothetical protein
MRFGIRRSWWFGLAAVLLGVGLALGPGPARADSGTATLTVSAPARTVTGSVVTISGTLTEAGAPVAASPVAVTVFDEVTGYSNRSATTNADGDWSTTVKGTGDAQVTANASDVTANQATATIIAVATVTLRGLAPSVPHPLLLDPATVTAAPAGMAAPVLQVRLAGSSVWRTAPDTSGVWGSTAGVIYVRALVPGQAGIYTQGVSTTFAVRVRNGKVPGWLTELNAYRALNDAPPVAESAVFDHGDALHDRYMLETGDFSHVENPKSKWYTKLGAEAGESSDLYWGSSNPVAGWAAAPYHAVSELSRYNTLAGYSDDGIYAALWTLGAATSTLNPAGLRYQFPANGKTTGLLTYAGDESPNPLSACPRAWQSAPVVGLPIIFGNQLTVAKPSATVTSGRTSLRVCVVNSGIYFDAVFVIPLVPLGPHRSYTVTVRYNGKVQSHWTFRTS